MKIKKHAEMNQFAISNNELELNGVPFSRLVNIAGRTPFYAYDRSVIKSRISELRKLFKFIDINYAIKANPMPELVSYMAGLVDGFDLASVNEMRTALNAGMKPSKISLAGPAKTYEEILSAVSAGIVIHAESNTQIELIKRASEETGVVGKVALRVNPPNQNASSGMRMGGAQTQFGIDYEKAADAIRNICSSGLIYEGLHVFNGSQDLSVESLKEGHIQTFKLASELQKETGKKIKKLNIGGGFGIPYFPGQERLDIHQVSENFNKIYEQYLGEFVSTCVVMELGRYLVGESGIYVGKIIDKKESRGAQYLILDAGMHHNLAASGNLGQVFRKNYPCVIANKVQSSSENIVNIVGPLCTPLDRVAEEVNLGHGDIGDYVAVYQSGAYGLTASPNGFLSHEKAVELLV